MPLARHVSGEIEPVDSAGGEEDRIDLTILAEGDPDRPAGHRVLSQLPAGRDPPDLVREPLREPECAVRARDDPVRRCAVGELIR